MPEQPTPETARRFIDLFGGLQHVEDIGAYGTGKGEWVKAGLNLRAVALHLMGQGSGIGIPPLGSGNLVSFAAIDLDEPNFDAAFEMQEYLPGVSFVERSRSGNAHVWVFFAQPIKAYIPMGILKEATLAAGKKHVEVFPKNHDFEKVRYGNYINLPYYGESRPIICGNLAGSTAGCGQCASSRAGSGIGGQMMCRCRGELSLSEFLDRAEEGRNDPEVWAGRARWLLIEPPERREAAVEFGEQPNLHMCAEYLLEHAEDNPVMAGHRSVVYFSLAKQLTNWRLCDHDEALMYMRLVNDVSPDKVPDEELRRILGNAERGGFTSTGCDDPLFAPYAHPNCKIAQGG